MGPRQVLALNPPQRELETAGYLSSGFNLVVHMATGSGKTWMARRLVEDVVQRGRRAVVVTPLRALAAELAASWAGIGAPLGVFTGERSQSELRAGFKSARVLVMTPERLDACGRAWRSHWHWIPDVDLLIVDELHLLGDPGRGRRLEGAISRFRRLNPFARLVGLTATIGNAEEIASWFGGVSYTSHWRPIPLGWRFERYSTPDEKPEVLIAALTGCVRDSGQSLVFVHSRRRAEEISGRLASAGFRVAHHHAGLDRLTRASIESRMRGGEIEILVATSTLELGVNLPVRQVVLYDTHQFDGSAFRSISTNAAWQRAGRAGRPGLDDQGEVVVLAARWDRELEALRRGTFEPVVSTLDSPPALAEQILAEIDSGLARTDEQVERALAQSLAAHQRRLCSIETTIVSMKTAGLLAEVVGDDGPSLKATRLGRVASRHMLMPASVLTLKAAVTALPDATFLDLLIACAVTEDCQPTLNVDYEELQELAESLAEHPSYFLASLEKLGALGVGGRRVLAAIKSAIALRTWTRSGVEDEVAAAVGCYPFELGALRESVVRLLQALLALVATNEDSGTAAPLSAKVGALRSMVEVGLDEEAVTLTLIPGIGPALARRLSVAGIADIESLACSEPGAFAAVRGVTSGRATRWIALAEAAIREEDVSAFQYREDRGPHVVTAEGWPRDVEPYRFRRALDLTVEVVGADFKVQGGLDPHMVDGSTMRCDCADAAKGPECKHVLAMRLHQGDARLRGLERRLAHDARPVLSEGVDLARLWLARDGDYLRDAG